MPQVVNECSEYLKDVLGVDIVANKLSSHNEFPILLVSYYEFYKTRILNTDVLLLCLKQNKNLTPSDLMAHYRLLREKLSYNILFVLPVIKAYERRRLIDYKIPFVVPFNQLYIPDLGIDLREYFKRLREKPDLFKPSTQLIFLYMLYRDIRAGFIISEIAKVSGYSKMTVFRAFDEITAAGIMNIYEKNKELIIKSDDSKAVLWEKALQYLIDPVKDRVYINKSDIDKIQSALISGYSALAYYSDLSEPDLPVYAVDINHYRVLRQNRIIDIVPTKDRNVAQLEIYKYPVHILSQSGVVDKLSLYLSLKNDIDERVEYALKKLIEEALW